MQHSKRVHVACLHVVCLCDLDVKESRVFASAVLVLECCKTQWVWVHQRIALYKSYLLLLLFIITVVVWTAMYRTSYSDSLTGFHEPLSPPYRCHTSLKTGVVQSLIVSHGVPDHTVCVKITAHGHLHDTSTAHLSAAVTVYRTVS